jgi:fermentation-respiration switch protein FrsA (DUF1100 family)
MYSCIDCDDSNYRVYRLDGNGYPEEPLDCPTDDYWYLEADTIEDWFSDSLDKQQLSANQAVLRAKLAPEKPWWRFW